MDEATRRRRRAAALAGVFLLAFFVRSLYAVTLAPVMYGPLQPGTRMAWRYDDTAVAILSGEGILWPRNPDPARTGLLARPPGYGTFLAGIYATLGRSFFAAQLVQNVLTSLASVLLVLAARRLVDWRTALLAGLVAALSPHLGFTSNMVLPDALSALPLVAALLALARAHPDGTGSWRWSAVAGALVGVGVWLRPNVVLLAPFLAVALVLLSRLRARALVHGAVLTAVAAAAVLPITVRNYAIFRELVPVSINGGLTFWQGVADAGGEAAGARRRDKLVMEEEAVRYANPRYREWWAEPDGIWRDRDRYRRAREVISADPVRYARVMLGRIGAMLHYGSGEAPTVAFAGIPEREDRQDGEAGSRRRDLGRTPTDERYLVPGRAAAPLRPLVAVLQAVLLAVLSPLVAVGTWVLVRRDWRKAALLLAIPLYYLLSESFFIYEWRVVAPMHYGLFVAAAAGALVLVDGVARRLRRRRS
jgi:4-amino-4-deoxy-L-arabinose transferase-like glycosyltransferase